MITITDNAVSELKNLLASKGLGNERGLRIGISRGGCAGLQYDMELDAQKAGDEITERNGVKILISPDSLDLLRGVTLDFVDELAGSGFRIVNPNATRSCGCGTSFEPASKTDEVGAARETAEV